jgi:DNA-binding transcriptional LysR family regulator
MRNTATANPAASIPASPSTAAALGAAPRLPALDRLVAFDAAARHLSFTKAAAERFLTQSAISRQIAALEEEIGSPLFVRRHRALELTLEGARLHAAVTEALATVREAVAAIRAPHRRQVLSLTTTPGLASLWLIPRLQGFVAEHPSIDVRIDASHDVRALAGEGFDIAIRYARLDSDIGEPLFAESVQPVCAPALLQGPHPLRTLADLRHHTLLMVATQGAGSSGMPIDWQAWLRAVGADRVEPAATLTFTTFDTAVAAALEGQGLVLGRRPLLDRLLEQGRLVAPLEGGAASVRGYFLVVDPVSARQPAVQAVVDWLRAEARAPGRRAG